MRRSARPDVDSISGGQWARFIFIAGRLCMDFMQTGGQTGQRAEWERLRGPADLTDWLAASPLQLPGIPLHPDEFREALALREAIWRAARAVLHGQAPQDDVVQAINRAAAHPDVPPLLVPESQRRAWGSPATAAAALSIIARDAIDLFSGEQRSRIRECANPDCGLMFVDSSRPGKRRWCLMKRCGNISKTARYRQRRS